MVEKFSNDFVVGNKADHTQGPTALTFQRIDLLDPFDEPRPTFSESGALFRRELGFGLGFTLVRSSKSVLYRSVLSSVLVQREDDSEVGR